MNKKVWLITGVLVLLIAGLVFWAAARLYYPKAGLAYLSNEDSGIAVMDIAQLGVIQRFPLKDHNPRGLGITGDGKILVTADKDHESVLLLDAHTGAIKHMVKVGKNPEFVRVLGTYAYVSYEPASTGKPPVADSGQEKPDVKAEAGDDDDDDDDEPKEPAKIAVVDLKQGQVVREIVGGVETEGIEFSRDGSQLIVTNEANNTITVHDIQTGNLLKTVSVAQYGDRPRGIKVAPNGLFYVATLESSDNFLVLDQNFNVIKTIATGKSPYGISFSPDGTKIFVVASKDKTMHVFDAKTLSKIKDITNLGKRCWHFSFTPKGDQILLACGRSNELLAIDAQKLELVKRVTDPTFDMPWGVVVYPKSLGSLDQPEARP